ncbi:MAG: HD domain-containing protein [Moheibacter sp.]
MNEENLLEQVKAFAAEAHGEQKRKYCDDPYIVHPIRVMELCREHKGSLPVLAACLLHDVLEDTDTDEEAMSAFLHSLLEPAQARKALQLVIELTDVYTHEAYPQWNRDKRKAQETERLRKISPQAQTIKYADIIDNSKEIVPNDPGFAPRYLKECGTLLEAMDKGNPTLRKEAIQMVRNGLEGIGKKRNKSR